ncbi:hypothetical protein CR513_33916, partial [Mucuna pruriens]
MPQDYGCSSTFNVVNLYPYGSNLRINSFKKGEPDMIIGRHEEHRKDIEHLEVKATQVISFYIGLLLRSYLDSELKLETYSDIGQVAFGIVDMDKSRTKMPRNTLDKCGFRKWMTREEVYDHLLYKPFPYGYTFWCHHREILLQELVSLVNEECMRSTINEDPMQDLINDAFQV